MELIGDVARIVFRAIGLENEPEDTRTQEQKFLSSKEKMPNSDITVLVCGAGGFIGVRSHRGFAHLFQCSRHLCWRPSAGILLKPQNVHGGWRNPSTSERARETTPPTIKQSAR